MSSWPSADLLLNTTPTAIGDIANAWVLVQAPKSGVRSFSGKWIGGGTTCYYNAYLNAYCFESELSAASQFLTSYSMVIGTVEISNSKIQAEIINSYFQTKIIGSVEIDANITNSTLNTQIVGSVTLNANITNSSLSVTISGGVTISNATLAVTQSGTWNMAVSGGVTINNSTIAVTQSGTWNMTVSGNVGITGNVNVAIVSGSVSITSGSVSISGNVNVLPVPTTTSAALEQNISVSANDSAYATTVSLSGNLLWALFYVTTGLALAPQILIDGNPILPAYGFDPWHGDFTDVGAGMGFGITKYDGTLGNYCFMYCIKTPFAKTLQVGYKNVTAGSLSGKVHFCYEVISS